MGARDFALVMPLLGTAATLVGCAPTAVLDRAGPLGPAAAATDWACEDGAVVRAVASNRGSVLRLESGPNRRVLTPEPTAMGDRWVDDGVSFWVRGPDDALLRTPAGVASCRGLP